MAQKTEDFIVETFVSAVMDGDVVEVANLFKLMDKNTLNDLEGYVDADKSLLADVACMEHRSQMVFLLCAFYKSMGICTNFSKALFNAVIAKKKQNVNTLLKFGACFNRLKFGNSKDFTLFDTNLSEMRIVKDDCNDKNCHACDDTLEYSNFLIDLECRGDRYCM